MKKILKIFITWKIIQHSKSLIQANYLELKTQLLVDQGDTTIYSLDEIFDTKQATKNSAFQSTIGEIKSIQDPDSFIQQLNQTSLSLNNPEFAKKLNQSSFLATFGGKDLAIFHVGGNVEERFQRVERLKFENEKIVQCQDSAYSEEFKKIYILCFSQRTAKDLGFAYVYVLKEGKEIVQKIEIELTEDFPFQEYGFIEYFDVEIQNKERKKILILTENENIFQEGFLKYLVLELDQKDGNYTGVPQYKKILNPAKPILDSVEKIFELNSGIFLSGTKTGENSSLALVWCETNPKFELDCSSEIAYESSQSIDLNINGNYLIELNHTLGLTAGYIHRLNSSKNEIKILTSREFKLDPESSKLVQKNTVLNLKGNLNGLIISAFNTSNSKKISQQLVDHISYPFTNLTSRTEKFGIWLEERTKSVLIDSSLFTITSQFVNFYELRPAYLFINSSKVTSGIFEITAQDDSSTSTIPINFTQFDIYSRPVFPNTAPVNMTSNTDFTFEISRELIQGNDIQFSAKAQFTNGTDISDIKVEINSIFDVEVQLLDQNSRIIDQSKIEVLFFVGENMASLDNENILSFYVCDYKEFNLVLCSLKVSQIMDSDTVLLDKGIKIGNLLIKHLIITNREGVSTLRSLGMNEEEEYIIVGFELAHICSDFTLVKTRAKGVLYVACVSQEKEIALYYCELFYDGSIKSVQLVQTVDALNFDLSLFCPKRVQEEPLQLEVFNVLSDCKNGKNSFLLKIQILDNGVDFLNPFIFQTKIYQLGDSETNYDFCSLDSEIILTNKKNVIYTDKEFLSYQKMSKDLLNIGGNMSIFCQVRNGLAVIKGENLDDPKTSDIFVLRAGTLKSANKRIIRVFRGIDVNERGIGVYWLVDKALIKFHAKGEECKKNRYQWKGSFPSKVKGRISAKNELKDAAKFSVLLTSQSEQTVSDVPLVIKDFDAELDVSPRVIMQDVSVGTFKLTEIIDLKGPVLDVQLERNDPKISILNRIDEISKSDKPFKKIKSFQDLTLSYTQDPVKLQLRKNYTEYVSDIEFSDGEQVAKDFDIVYFDLKTKSFLIGVVYNYDDLQCKISMILGRNGEEKVEYIISLDRAYSCYSGLKIKKFFPDNKSFVYLYNENLRIVDVFGFRITGGKSVNFEKKFIIEGVDYFDLLENKGDNITMVMTNGVSVRTFAVFKNGKYSPLNILKLEEKVNLIGLRCSEYTEICLSDTGGNHLVSFWPNLKISKIEYFIKFKDFSQLICRDCYTINKDFVAYTGVSSLNPGETKIFLFKHTQENLKFRDVSFVLPIRNPYLETHLFGYLHLTTINKIPENNILAYYDDQSTKYCYIRTNLIVKFSQGFEEKFQEESLKFLKADRTFRLVQLSSLFDNGNDIGKKSKLIFYLIGGIFLIVIFCVFKKFGKNLGKKKKIVKEKKLAEKLKEIEDLRNAGLKEIKDMGKEEDDLDFEGSFYEVLERGRVNRAETIDPMDWNVRNKRLSRSFHF